MDLIEVLEAEATILKRRLQSVPSRIRRLKRENRPKSRRDPGDTSVGGFRTTLKLSDARLDGWRGIFDSLLEQAYASARSNRRLRLRSDTTRGGFRQPRVEAIEMNGRLVGTRTPDLHRVKVAL